MDPISFSLANKQARRIKKFIANPDSNSGVLTQPKVIEAGETVTIKSGRQAILAGTVVNGDLVIEAGADVFVPAGAGFNDLDQRIDTLDIKIDELQTLSIGAILNGYTIFDNCIVAFGGEFNRADYPKLWAYLQANPSLVKTQAQWQTEATANGGICGFFSDGNGTTTFRVPNLDKAFLRPDSRGVGSYQGDAIRNITGSFQVGYNYRETIQDTVGAFSEAGPTVNYISAVTPGDISGRVACSFDASLVVPTANENRPKNIATLPLIVAK